MVTAIVTEYTVEQGSHDRMSPQEEGGEEEEDPAAEKEDLQVAWEALETAKVLYQRTADTNAQELAG
jgi:hypothetical protein